MNNSDWRFEGQNAEQSPRTSNQARGKKIYELIANKLKEIRKEIAEKLQKSKGYRRAAGLAVGIYSLVVLAGCGAASQPNQSGESKGTSPQSPVMESGESKGTSPQSPAMGTVSPIAEGGTAEGTAEPKQPQEGAGSGQADEGEDANWPLGIRNGYNDEGLFNEANGVKDNKWTYGDDTHFASAEKLSELLRNEEDGRIDPREMVKKTVWGEVEALAGFISAWDNDELKPEALRGLTPQQVEAALQQAFILDDGSFDQMRGEFVNSLQYTDVYLVKPEGDYSRDGIKSKDPGTVNTWDSMQWTQDSFDNSGLVCQFRHYIINEMTGEKEYDGAFTTDIKPDFSGIITDGDPVESFNGAKYEIIEGMILKDDSTIKKGKVIKMTYGVEPIRRGVKVNPPAAVPPKENPGVQPGGGGGERPPEDGEEEGPGDEDDGEGPGGIPSGGGGETPGNPTPQGPTNPDQPGENPPAPGEDPQGPTNPDQPGENPPQDLPAKNTEAEAERAGERAAPLEPGPKTDAPAESDYEAILAQQEAARKAEEEAARRREEQAEAERRAAEAAQRRAIEEAAAEAAEIAAGIASGDPDAIREAEERVEETWRQIGDANADAAAAEEGAGDVQAATADDERARAAEAAGREEGQRDANAAAKAEREDAEAKSENDEARDAEDWASGAFDLG